MARITGSLLLLIILAAQPSYGAIPISNSTVSNSLIGGEVEYTVGRGDIIELVAARVAMDWWRIVKLNGLDINKHLVRGAVLKANNRKIVPSGPDISSAARYILINIPERMLYYFKDGLLKTALPVALGVAKKGEETKWQTPTGNFKVLAKAKDPAWHIPPSIQEEMIAEGKSIINTVIPPGPENPLGKYAVKLSIQGVLIHATIWPSSVFQFRSHGCIRMGTEDMEAFFKEVEIDTPGELIYKPVKVWVSPAGRVYLEVHRDAYKKIKSLKALAKAEIEKAGAADKVDWIKVEAMVKERAGLAEDITK